MESPAAATYFPGLNLSGAPSSVFGTTAGKDLLVDPLVNRMLGTNLSTQPTGATLKTGTAPAGEPARPGLYALIDQLSTCSGACPANRTRTIAKATCGAVLGSSAVLIQ